MPRRARAARARDMAGTGRYPPTPKHPPIAFYSAIRLSDPEMLSKIMAVDPYFITQDNGMGAPVHFATTYGRLDMLHHLLNQGAEVNQQDPRGLTPLHRAAHLAHLDGYLEIYEYLLSRGANPSLAARDIDEYLQPGPHLPVDMAASPDVAAALKALEQLYAHVPKARVPHAYIGDWWTLYDYGPDAVKAWAPSYEPDFPEERRRKREKAAAQQARVQRRILKNAFLAALEQGGPTAARELAAKSAALTQQPVPAVGAVPTCFLFPGQGSQALGMLDDSTLALPEVQTLLATARTVLGYDLLPIMKTGPKELLDSTKVAQPALLVASLAATYRCAKQDPAAGSSCVAAAGLSVGEYAALVWAGAMSPEDGLRVVAARGKAMSDAAEQGPPHGMLSVVGLDDADLDRLCKQVLCQVTIPGGTVVCQVANRLFPQGRVVSGHTTALDLLRELALGAGALKAQMLPVSGAFHTRLMAPARQALAAVLDSVELHPPRLPVYSNVTAQPFPDDPAAIRTLLLRQLEEPVQWEATLRAVIAHGKAAAPGGVGPRLHELGPGQQIKAMVRRLDADAWQAFVNITA